MSTSSTQPTGSSATKRLLHELHTHSESGPHPFLLELGPVSDAQLLRWEAVMKGLPGTAYEGVPTPPSSRSFTLYRGSIDIYFRGGGGC